MFELSNVGAEQVTLIWHLRNSLTLALRWYLVQKEKREENRSSLVIFIYKQSCNSLHNIVSNLFTFALAFSIPQVSGSNLHKQKKWLSRLTSANSCLLMHSIWARNWNITLENKNNLNTEDVRIIETRTIGRHFTWRKGRIAYEKKGITRSIKHLNYPNLVLSLDTNECTTGVASWLE